MLLRIIVLEKMRYLVFILFLFTCLDLFSFESKNNIYWIQLNTKSGNPFDIKHPEQFLSERSLERRARQGILIDSTDLPVTPVYIDSLKSLGFNVKHTSRWMNGVIATYDSTKNIDSLNLPSFVSYVELRKGFRMKSKSDKFEKADSLEKNVYAHSSEQVEMLNGHKLHNYSKGKGVYIAVLDAGFENADSILPFENIRSEGRILGTRDFVEPGNNVYEESNHGTMVLSCMAMNKPGEMVGTAPESSYLLLRSEDVDDEFPIEEDYWIIAAEFADSVGCDVINTSLGYTVFDNSDFNHNYDEYTGDSIRISKAANIAVSKGIVVVCSAGNEGDGSWRYISFPSEARDVLCVASVDSKRKISYFSSVGFENDTTILKPDVAAMGTLTSLVSSDGQFVKSNGTSFSGPLIAGMAACLVGLFPDKKAIEIIDMIIKAGDRYPLHNDEYGFGIPDFGSIVEHEEDSLIVDYKQNLLSDIKFFPNPVSDFLFVNNNSTYKYLQIISLAGTLVYSAEIPKGSFTLDTGNLNTGAYILKFKGDTQCQSFKILKQ
jgi:hypothetical protein